MIEKGRISGGQMALLLFVSTIGITVATIPYLAAKWAKQDMWMTPVPAAASGLVAFFLAYFLHRRFPGETVIQYCPRILGWLGKVIPLVFLLTYIHANSFVLRIYADFVNGVFLQKTPQVVVMGGMALLCAAAVRGDWDRRPYGSVSRPADGGHPGGGHLFVDAGVGDEQHVAHPGTRLQVRGQGSRGPGELVQRLFYSDLSAAPCEKAGQSGPLGSRRPCRFNVDADAVSPDHPVHIGKSGGTDSSFPSSKRSGSSTWRGFWNMWTPFCWRYGCSSSSSKSL